MAATAGASGIPYTWDITRDQADVTLSTHADDFLKGDHEFKFGVSYGLGEGDTVTAGGVNGVYYYRNGYEYYSYYYYLSELLLPGIFQAPITTGRRPRRCRRSSTTRGRSPRT